MEEFEANLEFYRKGAKFFRKVRKDFKKLNRRFADFLILIYESAVNNYLIFLGVLSENLSELCG